jgi:hypothetical protein
VTFVLPAWGPTLGLTLVFSTNRLLALPVAAALAAAATAGFCNSIPRGVAAVAGAWLVLISLGALVETLGH